MSNVQILQMVGAKLGHHREYRYQGWTLDNGVLRDPHGRRWEYEVAERYDARCMDGWRYGARVAAIAPKGEPAMKCQADEVCQEPAVYRLTFKGRGSRGVYQGNEVRYYCAPHEEQLDVQYNDAVLGCVHRDCEFPRYRWTDEELSA